MGCQRDIQVLDFPLSIKWYITGKCNLRCTHCYLSDYTKEPDFDLVVRTLSYLKTKKVKNVSFLGGEPFYRSDFLEILDFAIKAGFVVKVATNGLMLTPEFCQKLKQIGLKYIQVSLEGHSAEINDPVRGKGTFDKIIAGVANAADAQIWTSAAFTLSSLNVKALPQLFERTSQAKAQQIRLAAFFPVGTGASARDYMLSEDDLEYIHKTLPDLAKQYAHMYLESAFVEKKIPSCVNQGRTLGCGAGTSGLVINNDMSLSACDILTEEDRTTERITHPEQIAKMWKTHPHFNKWRGLDNTPTPTIADFTEVHQEKCHVAYATYGKNIWKPAQRKVTD